MIRISRGRTPICYAKKLDVIQFLIEAGADVKDKSMYRFLFIVRNGIPLLHHVIRGKIVQKTFDIVHSLIKGGVDVNEKSK